MLMRDQEPVSRPVGLEEKTMLLAMIRQTVNKYKQSTTAVPVEMTIPIQTEDGGFHDDQICRVVAKMSTSPQGRLCLHLDFNVFTFFNQKVADIKFQLVGVKTDITEDEISNFLSSNISLENVPIYRGVYSFEGIRQVITHFILRPLTATVLHSSTHAKTLAIGRSEGKQELLSLTIDPQTSIR